MSLLVGYSLVLMIIGFHNYKRIGEPNLYVFGIKTALYVYLAPQVLAKKNNLSVAEARKTMKAETKIWIEKNDIDVIQSTTSFSAINSETTKDKKKYYNYLQQTALKIIFENPFDSIQYIFKQSLHTLVLNPVYINNFYKYDPRSFHKSEIHKKWIPIRIIYSVIIYLVIFLGIIYSLKHVKKEIIFLLFISVAYVITSLGWMGIPRYFVPALIFLSIFFGNGMSTILSFNKKNILK